MSAARLTFVWSCATALMLPLMAGVISLADSPAELEQALDAGGEGARKAASQLGDGPKAKAAVPALAKAMLKHKGALAQHIARVLASIGPDAAEAVPALTELLADADPRTKSYAAYALGEIGAASKSAAGELIKLLADADPLVRRSSVNALRKIKPGKEALPAFGKLLEDAQPQVVVAALSSIAEQGKDGVPVLVEALKSKKARYWAVLALGDLGADAKGAVEALSELLGDQDEEEVRMQVCHALAQIGPPAKGAAKKLVDLYESDKEAAIRYSAAYALGKIGAVEASDTLEKGTGSKDPFHALVSSWALAQLHPNDKAIVTKSAERIIEGLKSEDPKLRAAAAKALSESHASPELAAPAFEKAMADASPEVKATAIRAVAAMGAKAVPRLVLALEKSPSKAVRESALRVVGLIGPEAKDAVPAIVALLAKEEDPLARRELQVTLAMIGPASAPALAELKKSLGSEREEVRLSAIYALGKIGPAAAELVPELRKNVAPTGEDRFERVASVWALLRIKPGDSTLVKIAVPLLTRALENERENVRREAAIALGDLGAPAAAAIPALKKVAENDANGDVRAAAAAAAKKLEK